MLWRVFQCASVKRLDAALRDQDQKLSYHVSGTVNQIPLSPYVVDIFNYSELVICRTVNAVIVGRRAFAAIVIMNCGLFSQLFRILFLP